MAIYSRAYADQYDILMGNDKTISRTTKKLLKEFAPKKKQIKLLELGCGTGTILKQMPSRYQLYGLDIAESMLAIAKQKVPSATLVQGDMSNFSLRTQFGAILCIFDAINHLTTFTQWESMFKHVSQHLEPDGIFIFDMNTMRRLALLATFKPYVGKLPNNKMAFVKIERENDNLYKCQFLIFQSIKSKAPTVFEQIIEESVFPIENVEKALQKYFSIEAKIDPYRPKIHADSGRIFFVCKRK